MAVLGEKPMAIDKPVIEPPQAKPPAQTRRIRAGQAVRGNPEEWPGTRLSTTAWLRRSGACGEWPRDRHNKPAGEELDTDPAKRTVVNVGTRPVSPRSSRGAGRAQRLLMASGGGIALVVVVGVTTDHGGRCAARRLVVSPAQPGGTRRNVLGSNGLPRSER